MTIIRYPNITGSTPEERQTQLENYMRYLTDQLNWALKGSEKSTSSVIEKQASTDSSGKVATLEKKIEENGKKLNEAIKELGENSKKLDSYWETVYPVGSIYFSVSASEPGTLFGGTWERLKDRFLLAAGDTYGAGSTGGEANHTLTVNEMPSHNHNFWLRFTAGSDDSMYAYQALGNSGSSQAYSGATAGSGGNKSHNNMPPYIVVYVWKRIA